MKKDEMNLLGSDDLDDVFAQLAGMEDAADDADDEEQKASQRRYEEIIKKHKNAE